jgi:hypothetical protein
MNSIKKLRRRGIFVEYMTTFISSPVGATSFLAYYKDVTPTEFYLLMIIIFYKGFVPLGLLRKTSASIAIWNIFFTCGKPTLTEVPNPPADGPPATFSG